MTCSTHPAKNAGFYHSAFVATKYFKRLEKKLPHLTHESTPQKNIPEAADKRREHAVKCVREGERHHSGHLLN